jgi:hypothetical protein
MNQANIFMPKWLGASGWDSADRRHQTATD